MMDLHPLSAAGPVLIGLGLIGLTLSVALCRAQDVRRLMGARHPDTPPTLRERLWVHLAVSGGWSFVFGLVVAHGPPARLTAWDVRLPGEATWPVWQSAEFVYVLGYLTPLVVAWIPTSRAGLRTLAWSIIALTTGSAILFLSLPIATPPRPFVASSAVGRLLAWETSRADFAAASLPSFHAIWAMLLAQACATRSPRWAKAGWTWAAFMSVACIANGAHAVADVVASWILYGVARQTLAAIDRRIASRRLLPREATENEAHERA